MKVRMKVQLTGLYNGQPWPEVGEERAFPDVVGADLCAMDAAEPVAERKQPEKRAGKKS